MQEKVQNIDGSSNTNYVDAFMKISDTQEQIKLTVLFDFFYYKKLQIIVTFCINVRFLGRGGSKKTSTLFAQLGYLSMYRYK